MKKNRFCRQLFHEWSVPHWDYSLLFPCCHPLPHVLAYRSPDSVLSFSFNLLSSLPVSTFCKILNLMHKLLDNVSNCICIHKFPHDDIRKLLNSRKTISICVNFFFFNIILFLIETRTKPDGNGGLAERHCIYWPINSLTRVLNFQLTKTDHLTLMMASAHVVETSVTKNSPSQDSNHPRDNFQSSFVISMLSLFI